MNKSKAKKNEIYNEDKSDDQQPLSQDKNQINTAQVDKEEIKEPGNITKEEEKSNSDPKTKERKPVIFNWINKEHKKYKAWAALPELIKDYAKYIKCSWCNAEMLIQSLYGETGHLKTSTHIDKEKEHYQDKNKNEIIEKNVELIDDSSCKKLKMLEYYFCNLLIQMNLPFSDVEPIYNFLNKYSKSSTVKECKVNRHKVADTIKFEMLPFLRKSLDNDLRKYKFSLVIDESTDISNKNSLQ